MKSSVDNLPISLMLRGRIVMHSTLRYDLYEALSNQEPSPPRISCMMVTKNRVEQAKLAIQCFQNQTYPNKELIIIDDDASDRLVHHVHQLADPDIRHWHLEPENKTLGELRNLALSYSSGSYVCQWDDDDLSDPMRLQMQMVVMQANGADACFLQRWFMWWADRQRMAISRSRIWEGSMLCRKDKLILHPTDANHLPYPAERFGEDTPVVTQILQTCRVALLDQPQLYTYVIHQKNTFNDVHFEQHWQQASTRYEGIYHEELVQKLAERIPVNEYRELLGIAPKIRLNAVQPQPSQPTPQIDASQSSPESAESKVQQTQSEATIAINVTGHIDAEIGLGESARATVRSLKAAQIPLVLNNLHLTAKHPDTTYRNFSQDNPHPINLVHTNPDVLTSWMAAKTFYHWVKPDYFNNRYNIGYWVWETPTLPKQWQSAFKLFAEIWTPSSFSADAIAQVSPVPVIKMPHSIDLPVPTLDRAALNLPNDKFIFLFIFHPGSGYERKNPAAVIQVFKQAFGTANQEVLLILKTKDLPETAIAQLQTLTDNNPAIQIINESFTRDQINGLLHSCDCYVSLHRAEGFGLTIAEAMFYGKPAIATGYSGNTDYMTGNNSFLVNYKRVTLDQDLPPYQKGSQWAEPDNDHAAELMRYVFEHQEQAQEIGARAARDMRSQFSPQAIGRLIQQRLEWLVESDRLQSGKYRQGQKLPKRSSNDPPSSPARLVGERVVLDSTALPTVLILTPVKNAVEHLPQYLENVLNLDYPHDKISLGFLESDSSDGTFDWLQANLPQVSQKFRYVHLFRRDFHFNHYPLPRWEFRLQFNRRSVLAKSRNLLLQRALQDEDWVLWLDVDVAEYPTDVIQQLLQTGRDIVVPNCVVEPGGKTFDLNTFKFKPGAESQDWTPHMIDGIILPPAEGMMYLQDLRDQEMVEVDGVGGTMLLIKADLHREGLIFPTFSYNSYIETNGLAMMAKDMGYTCWGLPQLEIIHR